MITLFRNDHFFLSNFYPCHVEYEGQIYPSAEHAYQAAKSLDWKEREEIRKAATAREAKSLGRRLTLRPDWLQIRDSAMSDILESKFSDSNFKKMLLNTGNEFLVEGNSWSDEYWGAVETTNGWRGQNKLGELLMSIRLRCTNDRD